MSNPTSNFGWQMPTPTDLVTDLPADFEVFGQAVDTSMADLKGGTTGQILSKATNTDMDFTWITNDIGDITAVNTTAPLAGGATSGAVTLSVTTATTSATGVVQLSDSTSTTSSVLASTPTATKSAYDLAASAYAPAFTNNFYAGKNKVINGNFGVWQRGTSFTTGNLAYVYTADRWLTYFYGSNTASVTQQTFTPGTAPVAGYEGQFFGRFNSTSTANFFSYRVEDVRTLAGQTAVLSFWAKSNSSQTGTISVGQNFGSGGSATVAGVISGNPALTTSWQRFSYTAAIPSISGKTIGTSSYVLLEFIGAINNAIDIWGVQLEAGSVATPFQTATGTLQGELAACQRYYWRYDPSLPGTTSQYSRLGMGFANSTSSARVQISNPVAMRVGASACEYNSNIQLFDGVSVYAPTSLAIDTSTSLQTTLIFTPTSTSLTTYRPYQLYANGSTAAYVAVTAEL